MYTLVLRTDPNTDTQIARVRVRGARFRTQEGKRRGAHTWCVLVTGKGTDGAS